MKKLAINPSNKKYYSDDYIKGWENGVNAQYEATKDAVEVVRCKDCKHRYKVATDFYICDFMDEKNDCGGFCHHGKRRDPGYSHHPQKNIYSDDWRNCHDEQ